MDSTFTDEQIEEFREVFRSFDKNGDGVISLRELHAAVKTLGKQTSEIELKETLKEWDFDDIEEIRFDSFLNFLRRKLREPDMQAEMKHAFSIFDRSGSGIIRADDVQLVMGHMGERLTDEDAKEMIKMADPNHRGYVTYDDFVRFMTSKMV